MIEWAETIITRQVLEMKDLRGVKGWARKRPVFPVPA